jgi:thiol-disulfide isomerase/thioredoxin
MMTMRHASNRAGSRLVWAVALATLGGCATAGGQWRPQPGGPSTFVLLLNGGGAPNINYLSHAHHLAEMNEVLLARGLDRRQISVLASDGDSPLPDLAVGRPATARTAWLLDGTFLERPLGHPLRYLSTHIPNLELEPATRAGLASWLESTSRALLPGDTLLLFVTDHGERGKTPEESRIVLWQRQSVTARELGEMLGRFNPGVRVVTVMSQCFAGGFAEMALHPAGGRPVGSTCGFFATTADRGAWGCYAESTGSDRDEGYAFKFIAGLRRSNRLAAAHAQTLITDRSPDVPLRSSDIYLARFVERIAAHRGTSADELVGSLLPDALARDVEEVHLLRSIASSFAIPISGERAALEEQTRPLAELRGRLKDGADAWSAALGELTQANLEEFLAARPDWAPRLSPRALDRVPVGELDSLQQEVAADLSAFTARNPAKLARLSAGHSRETATRAASFRSEVRMAALLRVRTILTTLVGLSLLEREGSAQEKAELAALRACEGTTLPQEGTRGRINEEPVPFPTIASDERVAAALVPASLGATLIEVPPSLRSAQRLPDGAVTVAAIDPQSSASAAGLQPGDILIGEPAQPIVDRGAMKLFLASRTQQASDELEILRGNRRLVVRPSVERGKKAFEAHDLRAAGRAALGGLASFRGPLATALETRKPYLIFFWATWCTFCKEAIPELLELQRQRGIPILAVTDEPQATLEAFFDRWSRPFPEIVAVDTDRRANEAFAVNGYPTFVLVDERGRVAMRATGYRADMGLPIEGWRPRRDPAEPAVHH